MAGTKLEFQTKYHSYLEQQAFQNVGSFWINFGLPPLQVTVDNHVDYNLDWYDLRDTGSQQLGWRELKKEGENVTTHLYGQRTTLSLSNGHFEGRLKANVGTPLERHKLYIGIGHFYDFAPSSGGLIPDDRADNQARMEFYRNARKAQTILQAGVVAGELGQTLRGLMHTARQLRQGVGSLLNELAAYRKNSRRNHRHISKREATEYLSDTWLSYVYGWKPLINDLDDSMKLLAERNVDTWSDYKMVEGQGEDTAMQMSDFESAESYLRFRRHITETQSVKYYGKVLRYIPGPFANKTSLAAGLDTSNFLPTVWELIPYSFLVDYFANVQDVVSSFSFNQATLKWCNRTSKRTVVTAVGECEYNEGLPTEVKIEVLVPGEQTWIYTEVYRDPDQAPGVVDLRFQIPGIGDKRWLNMAALAGKSKSMTPYVW